MPDHFLKIHLGFMPEEISSKLKPELEKQESFQNNAIIIITRDLLSPAACELFEQSTLCYNSTLLNRSIENSQFSIINQKSPGAIPSTPQVNYHQEIAAAIEKFLTFDIETDNIQGLKRKLNGKPVKLSVLQVGQADLTDIYVQFPEMGFQPILALKLASGILHGIINWLTHGYKNKIQGFIIESFGAGGALNSKTIPGTCHTIQGNWSVRRWLKAGSAKPKCTLRFLKTNNYEDDLFPLPHSYFNILKSDDHFLAQETARYFFLRLGGFDKDKIQLSGPYRQYLFAKNNEYKESITNILGSTALIAKKSDQLNDLMSNSEEFNTQLEDEIFEASTKQKAAESKKKLIESDHLNKIEKALQPLLINLSNIRENIKKLTTQELASTSSALLSCSAGMFIDEPMKKAAHCLFEGQAVDANMEDDLVIKLQRRIKKWVNYYAEIRKVTPSINFQCYRVQSDPFFSDEFIKSPEYGTLLENFRTWGKTKRYTIHHYVDAILWGASGFDDDLLTDNARWDLIQKTNNVDSIEPSWKTFVLLTNKSIIIDPFWREIATDFLSSYPVLKTLKDRLLKKSKNELNKTENTDEIKSTLAAHLIVNGFEDGDNGDFYVWIRKQSWGGNTEERLDKIPLEDNIDRAFYISSNLTALNNAARSLFQQASTTPGLQASSAESAPSGGSTPTYASPMKN